MGKTQYYTATRIDGFIADEQNSLSWLFEVPAGDDDVGHEQRFAGFFAEVGAMAMGATTYEWVLEHEQLLEHPEKWRATTAIHPVGCSRTAIYRRSKAPNTVRAG